MQMADLPENWWQQRVACQTLGEWFSHHLIGLFFSVDIEGKKQQVVYTGLVLLYENKPLWITAGHVIDEIRSILSDPKIKIEIMRWLDGYEVEGAESIPVHNRNLNMFSATEFGVDFGAIMITGLDAENMKKNDRIQLITEQIWENLNSAKPEGYYIVGYPKEWTEYHETRLSDNQSFNSFRANIACLPVRQIEYRGDAHSHKEFWSDPEAFYGQILPFVDEPNYQPVSVKGMSGGPLFSIERDPSNQIRYRLFGIQRSEDKSEEHLIRAETIQKIFDLMES